MKEYRLVIFPSGLRAPILKVANWLPSDDRGNPCVHFVIDWREVPETVTFSTVAERNEFFQLFDGWYSGTRYVGDAIFNVAEVKEQIGGKL